MEDRGWQIEDCAAFCSFYPQSSILYPRPLKTDYFQNLLGDITLRREFPLLFLHSDRSNRHN
jgi:hypothetical protein